MALSVIESSPILQLSVLLVILGLVVFGIVLYLKRQSVKVNNAILNLYQLNREVEQDVLNFIQLSWPILAEAGFESLFGQVVWFGETRVITLGKKQNILAETRALKSSRFRKIQLEEGDIQVQLHLVFSRDLRGEKKLMADIISQTYSVLLSSNITSKNMQFILSKERLERFQLFVQHDVKNLAQFMALLDHQIQQCRSTDKKIALVDRLKILLPSQTEKANKVIGLMRSENIEFNDVETIELGPFILQCAAANDLVIALEGQVEMSVSKLMLQQVLSELMANFKTHSEAWQKPGNSLLRVNILALEADVFISFKARTSDEEILKAERLFEPFWTTSTSGMGLGLFIVREMLKAAQGRIEFIQLEEEIVFNITLPRVAKAKAIKSAG